MNNTIILTSYLDFDIKDELNNRTPKNFGNLNGILDKIKDNVIQCDNFLYVASDESAYEITDYYANICFKSFDLTFPFKNYNILDGRTKYKAKELINNADFIFLCGGHTPTQNKFFHDINLKELIKDTNAVICGGSAGSMNCATTVYCPPELPGEALDNSFQRYFNGLGLTDINILPHFDKEKDIILDEKKYLEDIILPDSYQTNILALNDGSYLVIKDGEIEIFGEAYTIVKGIITKICENNDSIIFFD